MEIYEKILHSVTEEGSFPCDCPEGVRVETGRLFHVYCSFRNQFEGLKIALKKRLQELQDNCDCSGDRIPHFEKINGSDPKDFTYEGSFCLTCGKFFPRKNGSPFEVCHSCGADMEPQGEEKKENNKGLPVVLFRVYVCPQCNRIERGAIRVYVDNL